MITWNLFDAEIHKFSLVCQGIEISDFSYRGCRTSGIRGNWNFQFLLFFPIFPDSQESIGFS